MSAFVNHGALLSIGGATLYTIGLNPQRLSFSSAARFPAHATQDGLLYQKTGMGARTLSIEATTLPHIMGGMDAYQLLLIHHRAQAIVPFLRLRGNYLAEASGMCVIETLEADEEKLHPADGIGRKVDVSIGLIMMPDAMTLTDRSRVAGIGIRQ